MAVKISKQPAAKNAPAEAKGGKASDVILSALKKTHGDTFGHRGGGFAKVDRVMTGIFPLDLATGGGFPRGKSSIIYGPESSGKTVILYKLIAYVQRELKQTAVLIDVENSHDASWAENFGVNTKDLIVVTPDSAEQAIDATEAFMHADDVGIVGLDSLAMLVTQNELEKDASVAAVGGASALIGKLYRKVGSGLTQQRKKGVETMFVAVNQIRHKIGVMFGDPESMPGGNIPKFVSSLTLRVYGKKEVVKEINEDAPSILRVKGVIKKFKVPIVGTAFEYDMALIPHEGLGVGEVASWKTVSNRLASMKQLSKVPSGYLCMGDQYKTLDSLKERYLEEKKFALSLQKYLFDNAPMIGVQK